jgi:hypothetical protein
MNGWDFIPGKFDFIRVDGWDILLVFIQNPENINN